MEGKRCEQVQVGLAEGPARVLSASRTPRILRRRPAEPPSRIDRPARQGYTGRCSPRRSLASALLCERPLRYAAATGMASEAAASSYPMLARTRNLVRFSSRSSTAQWSKRRASVRHGGWSEQLVGADARGERVCHLSHELESLALMRKLGGALGKVVPQLRAVHGHRGLTGEGIEQVVSSGQTGRARCRRACPARGRLRESAPRATPRPPVRHARRARPRRCTRSGRAPAEPPKRSPRARLRIIEAAHARPTSHRIASLRFRSVNGLQEGRLLRDGASIHHPSRSVNRILYQLPSLASNSTRCHARAGQRSCRPWARREPAPYRTRPAPFRSPAQRLVVGRFGRGGARLRGLAGSHDLAGRVEVGRVVDV